MAVDSLFHGRPGVKVCGLTDPIEAQDCLAVGVDWLGLNFHPPSPRSITIDRAGVIAASLRRDPADVAVGLFVDRPPSEVRSICRSVGLTRVQLHGGEPPEALVELADFFLIRAFRLRDAASVRAMVDHLTRAERLGRVPDAVLIDAWSPGAPGGTGTLIAPSLLKDLPPLPRLILAGGLTPENVAPRIRAVRPWMVDLASGVESSPGRKDPLRVRALLAAVDCLSEEFRGLAHQPLDSPPSL